MKMKWFRNLALTIALVLVAGTAQAATTPNSVITAQTPTRGIVQFLQGTDAAGTYKTIYTAGSNGSKVVALYATSNDASAAHLVTCQIVNSAVKYGGTAVNVPTNSGFANATAQINMMSQTNWVGLPLDSDGNPFFYMVSGDTLQCTFATALTTSDVLNLIAVVADF
jgi:hypothetical protein